VYKIFGVKNLNEEDYFDVRSVERRIILKITLEKLGVIL
jgi:hypothetical protein